MEIFKSILKPLASLKFTIILLSMSMFLILAGTLAQRFDGIYEVTNVYFRTYWVNIELRVFFPAWMNIYKFLDGDPSVWYGIREFLPLPDRPVLPFPGGFLLSALLMVNLVAAHFMRFKMMWKRIGIVALHAGLILLLIGEFITGYYAEEGYIQLAPGEKVNYVSDARYNELAVVLVGEETDQVTVVPEQYLKNAGDVVSHPELPFEIKVVEWMKNSILLRTQNLNSSFPNPATAGRMKDVLIAVNQAEVSGVDQEQRDNMPSLYAEIFVDDKSRGVYLFTFLPSMDFAQEIEVDGKTYEVTLRRERRYRDYSISLQDLSSDTYVGTNVYKDFTSIVTLDDPSRNLYREDIRIWMNNPLRHAGETFYQSKMLQTEDGSEPTATVLFVVDNPAWLLPYISCVIVSLGLIVHFMISLITFLKRNKQRERKDASAEGKASLGSRLATGLGFAKGMGFNHRLAAMLPLIVTFIFVLYIGSKARPQLENEGLGLRTFAQLPVSSKGRVKPLDTVARNNLFVMSNRRTAYVTDRNGVALNDGESKLHAIEMFTMMIAPPDKYQRTALDARNIPIFRIEDDRILNLIGKSLGEASAVNYRFSFSEILPFESTIIDQYKQAIDVEEEFRSPYQNRLIALHTKIDLFVALKLKRLPLFLPPMEGHHPDWTTLGHHQCEDGSRWREIFKAYREQDATTFEAKVNEHMASMEQRMPNDVARAKFEAFFNQFDPFTQSLAIYLIIMLIALGGFLWQCAKPGRWSTALIRTAYWLLVIAFILHTFGLAARIYIQMRPPVTNLYSSAVFIGWGCVFLGLLFERFFKLGVATFAAAITGMLTLIVAINLDDGGDTMQMMQAVLDSNFWLATHVIVITLGYTAVFLAGAMAIVYVLVGYFTTLLNKERAAALYRMVYGVTCFGLLFSFVGTVLGGIWADQSWGRFWGWDPKENGAVLIVLITAIMLHARWDGMIRQRGLMVLAIFGNIVTSWSWFGTNMLGIGLHAYGFMDSKVTALTGFVVSQLILMCIAMLPLRIWQSREGIMTTAELKKIGIGSKE